MEIKSILITGGSGAFGKSFVDHLLQNTDVPRICVYSRGEFPQHQMLQERKQYANRLRFFIGDVRDYERLEEAMRDIEVVVHAAALKRIEVEEYNPVELVKTNIDGAINVIMAAHRCNVQKVVALSTDKAFQAVNLYGGTKFVAERLFLLSNNTRGEDGPRFAVCRYGNIWRSTGSVVPIWEQQIEDGADSVRVTDPECTRFYMTLKESVQLVMKTIETMPSEPEIPILPAYRVGDLVEAMGVKPVIVGLPPREKMHESMDYGNSSDLARRMTVDELKTILNDKND